MTSLPLLQLHQLTKRFGGVQALSSVSLTLRHGRVYGLAGENGAGKSTLVKILCGVHGDYQGRMELDQQEYRPRSAGEAERHGISVFHQEIPICPSLSVAANVFLGPDLSSRSLFPNWRRLEAHCEEMFRDLLGIEISARRLMGDCSPAERQLALLVRVLSRQARLVILDEPTTALTPPEVTRLFAVINRLRAKGLTFLFVSHLLDELLELCDEILVLRDGALVGHHQRGQFDARTLAKLIAGREGSEADVAAELRIGERFPARELAPSNALREKSGEKRPAAQCVSAPQSKVAGGERNELSSIDLASDTTPKLEVRNLSRGREFREISFRLNSGEILGITGLQGSGRSPVARALFGAPPAHTGEILLDGKKISIQSVADAIRNGIGYVPEDRQSLGLFDDLDVAANLGILRLEAMRSMGLLLSRRLRQLALSMQHNLQIKFASPDASIRNLSGGNQQKVLIGRWLTAEPKVLVMNEPTRGVDIGAKCEICLFIRRLAAEGCSFIVSSSDFDELTGLADRVLVMHGGRITTEFFRGVFRKEDLIHAVGASSREP